MKFVYVMFMLSLLFFSLRFFLKLISKTMTEIIQDEIGD